MTSFIIQSHVDRSPAPSWAQDDTCAFCRIVQGTAPAAKLYEDDEVIAILGVLFSVICMSSNVDADVHRYIAIEAGTYTRNTQNSYISTVRVTTRTSCCCREGRVKGRKSVN